MTKVLFQRMKTVKQTEDNRDFYPTGDNAGERLGSGYNSAQRKKRDVEEDRDFRPSSADHPGGWH